ncbi:hypothetical protein ACFLY4_09175 [Chloroflexota bacterium]
MTYEQIIVLISIIVAGITGLGTIVTGVRGYYWSKDYKESKQAQLDLKDERIELLEKESSTHMKDAFESMKKMLETRIDQLKIDVRELQNANERLQQQLDEAKSTNSAFVSNFPQVNLDTQQKQVLTQFVTASGEDLNNISGTADVYRYLEQKFLATTAEASDILYAEIKPPAKDDDEPKDENDESDDPEAPQPVDA